MLEVYRKFAEEYMAMPVVVGQKTEAQKFAGAVRTYCIEAMMGDRKALQAGTSHNLGQNFAKAFDVTYQSETGEREYVWATSWGVSTRLVGALIMAHGDDKGLILPPRLAPIQTVIVPIYRTDTEREQVLRRTREMARELKDKVRMKVDDRDQFKPGWKFNEWEMKGVPLRLEVGPRDVKTGQVVFARRDTGTKESLPFDALGERVVTCLDEIQRGMFERASRFRKENTHWIDDYEDFKRQMEDQEGFVYAPWCGKAACEERIQDETKATIRCIPFEGEQEERRCLCCRDRSDGHALFAQAY